MKLNLGSGDEKIHGFLNVDLYHPNADIKEDVSKLSFKDNEIEEIRAYHIIEHFDFIKGQDVIKEWYRVLKPGGILRIETPDFLGSCKKFVEATEEERINLYAHFFSTAWINDGMIHKFLYTETQLYGLLHETGFKFITRLMPDSNAYNLYRDASIFLNISAVK